MANEVSFQEQVTGSFTGAFEGQIEDRASGAISFLGTASWADRSITASFAESASGVLSKCQIAGISALLSAEI